MYLHLLSLLRNFNVHVFCCCCSSNWPGFNEVRPAYHQGKQVCRRKHSNHFNTAINGLQCPLHLKFREHSRVFFLSKRIFRWQYYWKWSIPSWGANGPISIVFSNTFKSFDLYWIEMLQLCLKIGKEKNKGDGQ